jgi:ADP-ribosylglycohydrolase
MQPLDRAYESLAGLSVGDSFGEQFFAQWHRIEQREIPPPPWHYTDDTQMALSIVSILRQYGEIDQQALALSFARHYEGHRGYGAAMHGALRRIGAGEPWEQVSRGLFVGQGSFGNGSAMRIAPLGAYFADDLHQVAEQASRAAEVTHAHPEAVAGATGVAIAAAYAFNMRGSPLPAPAEYLDRVLLHLPDSQVRHMTRQARDLPPDAPVRRAAMVLGNGSEITCQDTVPFVLWCASHTLADFREALWLTASGGGDIDTTCAMVGGIVAAYTGADGIPAEWRAACETLPNWYLSETPS